MIFNTTSVSVALAMTFFLSGCHTTSGPSEESDPTTLPTPTASESGVWLESFEQVMQAGPQSDKDIGCPAFTEGEAKSTFAPHVYFKHTGSVSSGGSVSTLRCWGRPFGNTGPFSTNDFGVWLQVERVHNVKSSNAKRPETWFDQYLPVKENTLSSATQQYPGFGLSTPDLDFAWVCGRHRIAVATHSRHAVLKPGLSPAEAMQDFFLARVKQLCGTVESPSHHVTEAPDLSWKVFETFGGTSPNAYSLPRPQDLPRSKRRDISR